MTNETEQSVEPTGVPEITKREIKFEYIFKLDVRDGIIFNRCVFTLDEIEKRIFTHREEILIARRQSTGLLDKNDKEIFEGDIIRVWENKNGYFEVVFINAYVGGWVLKHNDDLDLVSLGARPKKDIEIIGNIFENPELLTN